MNSTEEKKLTLDLSLPQKCEKCGVTIKEGNGLVVWQNQVICDLCYVIEKALGGRRC
jgi:hypothetical protein